MAEKEDKWIKVIAKLIKETQEENISWSVDSFDSKLRLVDEEYVDAIFKSQYKSSRYLRLYRKNFKTTDMQTTLPSTVFGTFNKAIGGIANERQTYWTSKIYLEIVDSERNLLFEFPSNQSLLRDLYNSVSYKVSGVEDFLDDFIGDS